MKVSIIGAGMAGLLAANMLSRYKPCVFEKQPTLPNNHSAVLRFRSPIVGDVLGIPFKKVTMIKTVLPWTNPVADALAYSFKNTGQYSSDRSVVSSSFVREDRYIAPQNLISQMYQMIPGEQFRFGESYFDPQEDLIGPSKDAKRQGIAIISTMPMPMLMNALNYKGQGSSPFIFPSQRGVNVKVKLYATDAYVSLYITNPEYPMSRISITGNEMIIEFPGMTKEQATPALIQKMIDQSFLFLGMSYEASAKDGSFQIYDQMYHKILPISDVVRKDFMSWATREFNIYSLGRFATWRPSLLLDDLVQDVRLIERWFNGSSLYEINRRK